MQLEALKAEFRLTKENLRSKKATVVQFDDLETFEHTKCKPLSVTLAVEEGSRRILGLEVALMRGKGRLASKARELYGERKDGRNKARAVLFRRIRRLLSEEPTIKSDSNPHYPASVKRHFPTAKHVTYLGKRGATTGQGELKKLKFDPLFSLNHTCAMLRANINRLFRKTWCTTKRADRLYSHLILYADYHNHFLLPKPA